MISNARKELKSAEIDLKKQEEELKNLTSSLNGVQSVIKQLKEARILYRNTNQTQNGSENVRALETEVNALLDSIKQSYQWCIEDQTSLRIEEPGYEEKYSALTEREADLLKLISRANVLQGFIKQFKGEEVLYNENCKCSAKLSEYKTTLDKLLPHSSSSVTMRGIITLSDYVMAFEYPKGFYLFDTFVEAGLYYFTDRDSFIRGIQSFVQTASKDFIAEGKVVFTVTSLSDSVSSEKPFTTFVKDELMGLSNFIK